MAEKQSLCLIFCGFYESSDPRTRSEVTSAVRNSMIKFGGGLGGTPRLILATWDFPSNEDIMLGVVDYLRNHWNQREASDMVIDVICNDFERDKHSNPNLDEIIFPIQPSPSLMEFQAGLYKTMVDNNIKVDAEYAPAIWVPRLVFGNNYPGSGVFMEKNQEDFVLLLNPIFPKITMFGDVIAIVNEADSEWVSRRVIYENEEKYEWGEVEKLFPSPTLMM